MTQKITKLEVTNFIGITEATIEPKKMTVIRGENGKGKTSFIQAILAGFKGCGADKIKVGSDSSTIFLKTEEIELRRRITAKGSSITVKKDGMIMTKPQAYLDGLIGDFSFEPVKFFTMKPEEQTEHLLKAIPVKATLEQLKTWTRGLLTALEAYLPLHGLEAIAKAEETLYAARAADNSRVKTLESAMSEIESKIPASAKEFKPEELQTVMDQISKSKELRQERARLLAKKDELTGEEGLTSEEIESMEAKIDSKKKSLARMEEEHANIKTVDLGSMEKARAELVEKLRIIEEDISRASSSNQKKADAATHISYLTKEIEETGKYLGKAQSKMEDLKEQQKNLDLAATAINPLELAPLEAKLSQFREAQSYQRDLGRLEDMRAELKTVRESAEAKDKAVKTLQTAAPAEILTAAKMPVEGLAYSNGQFTLRGVPIQNLSTSEKAWLAVAVTRYLNKDYPIKAICLDGFESLDSKTQKAFMEEAAKDDFQYFITCVGDNELSVKTE
jgi:hypothetical protein